MRIIAGVYRSRPLRAGKDRRVRPTSDKVKGALFNMIEPLEGCRVLDLYAGTGGLGIEALSRGASSVTFVDDHPGSLRLVRENLASLGLSPGDPRVRVEASDVLAACRRSHGTGTTFDVVLADPPYGNGALNRILEVLKTYPILAKKGILAVEHGAKDVAMPADFPWGIVRQRAYGDTALTLFQNT
jgi:16S rRNA (guanine(966)-N(2))-methyltransferase RsmD